jgi:acyl transferase domain-containing protein
VNDARGVLETATDAIAIVGLAGRFPGAPDVDRFWANLLAGQDSIRRFSAGELRAAGVPQRLLSDPRYVPAHGYLDGLTDFDADFFGYSPTEAAQIDPQHRLFLESAWLALQDGGFPPGQIEAPAGVFAGTSINRYYLGHLFRRPPIGDPDQAMPPGHAADYLPLRVAHKLGLVGPAVAIQAACASSLVAVALAAQSLLDFRCDLAIAGGASIAATGPSGYLARDGGLLAPDGVVRAFDADAAGTVYGSGSGAVVLQRLADARPDRVYAVIRGWGVTNDGHERAGFAVPGVRGLTAAVVEALESAQLSAADIGYVEAHGAGTPLGDAIEVQALATAYGGKAGTAYGSDGCRLGSVKTNIGNLDAAAGIAGLIKTVLAVAHGVLPASLHFRAPHPEVDLGGGPFSVVTASTAWPGPRYAGVSAVGLGGTNAHLVLGPGSPAPPDPTWHGLAPQEFQRQRHWIEPIVEADHVQ